MDVTERMSFFASLLNIENDPTTGMWMLYFLILVLSIVVYKLGFAKKLPIIKSVIVYFILALGCTILTFLAVFLPVAEGLVIAAIVLTVYKVRLLQSKKEEQA